MCSNRLSNPSPIPKFFWQSLKTHLLSLHVGGYDVSPIIDIFGAKLPPVSRHNASFYPYATAPLPSAWTPLPDGPASLRSAAAPPWSCKTHPISVRL